MGIWHRIIGRSERGVGDIVSDVALAEFSARLEGVRASVVFDEQRRSALRGRLMSRLATGDNVAHDAALAAAWIHFVAGSITMPAAAVARIRERLYALPFSRWSFLRQAWRPSTALAAARMPAYRFGSAIAIVALLTVATFSFVEQAPVTFASSVNIYEVTGDVSVMRGDEVIPAAAHLGLQSGDVIRTGVSGKVTVNYFDTSFTRVFEESNIVLQHVTSGDFGLTHSVGVDVIAGKMWSRVGDLVSDSDFTVRAHDIVASTDKRAVFFVSADAQRASLQVFQSEVSVMLPKHDAPKIVSTGYQAVAEQSRATVQPIHATDADRAFVAGNLSQDQHVLAQVDAAGTADGGALSPLKDNESLLLSLSASDRERLSLKFAERDFYDALKHETVVRTESVKTDSVVSDSVALDPVDQAFAHLRDAAKEASESDTPDMQRLAATVLDRARGALPAADPEQHDATNGATNDAANAGSSATTETQSPPVAVEPVAAPEASVTVPITAEDVPEMVLPPKVQLGRE